MLTLCPECGHKLWSEVGSLGALSMVMFSDDEEESDTYTEQVMRCPGVQPLALRPAIEPGEITQRG